MPLVLPLAGGLLREDAVALEQFRRIRPVATSKKKIERRKRRQSPQSRPQSGQARRPHPERQSDAHSRARAREAPRRTRRGGGIAAWSAFALPKIPGYDDLPVRAGAPAGAAWGVFGDDDEVGTINLLTPERVIAAAASIRSGKVFAMNLPINIPDPPLFTRGKHTHTVKIFPDRGLRARRLPRQLLSAIVVAMGRARSREASGASAHTTEFPTIK